MLFFLMVCLQRIQVPAKYHENMCTNKYRKRCKYKWVVEKHSDIRTAYMFYFGGENTLLTMHCYVIALHWRNLLLVCQENIHEQWLSQSSKFVVSFNLINLSARIVLHCHHYGIFTYCFFYLATTWSLVHYEYCACLESSILASCIIGSEDRSSK